MNWSELHQKLRKPFAVDDVSFRPGQTSHNSGRVQALPYAEPRVYEDRLNEVLGADWSCRFLPWGEKRLLCELSVRVHDDVGGVREITRTSTGEWDSGDKIAQGTSAEAQAFKRACSKFGLGRYLYDVPALWGRVRQRQPSSDRNAYAAQGVSSTTGTGQAHQRAGQLVSPGTREAPDNRLE